MEDAAGRTAAEIWVYFGRESDDKVKEEQVGRLAFF